MRAFLITSLVLLAIFVILTLGLQTRIKSLIATIQATHSGEAETSAHIIYNQNLAPRLKQAQAQLVKYQSQLPSKSALDQNLKTLADNQGTVVDFTSSPNTSVTFPSSLGHLYDISMTVSFDSYASTVTLLTDLRKQRFVTTIDSVEDTFAADKSGKVQMVVKFGAISQ